MMAVADTIVLHKGDTPGVAALIGSDHPLLQLASQEAPDISSGKLSFTGSLEDMASKMTSTKEISCTSSRDPVLPTARTTG